MVLDVTAKISHTFERCCQQKKTTKHVSFMNLIEVMCHVATEQTNGFDDIIEGLKRY
jgi:hypothetical protein